MPNFQILKAFMPVQMICKFLEAVIENKGATMFTSISHCKSMVISANRVLTANLFEFMLSDCLQMI